MSDLLRVATAGSVDDGKSTLLGRLLHDSKALFDDQLDAVTETSRRRGADEADLALLTDGLRAEREQGITIDVAYRYFATPRRTFVLADTPGHVQYTRNMVTGASTAHAALVLVDARQGVVEQTRRHAYLAALFGVSHVVLAVNKMDLVDFDQAVFAGIAADVRRFVDELKVPDVPAVTAVPVSALRGDNVVHASARTPWYAGRPLLSVLEGLAVADDVAGQPFRLPVQYVLRPRTASHHDYRGYAGQLAAGVLRVGDEVVALPSGLRTRVAGIDTFDGALDEAFAPMSVTVRLADELDVSRGDVLCHPDSAPQLLDTPRAMVAWLAQEPLAVGARYLVKQATRTGQAIVTALEERIDVNTSAGVAADGLGLNEIGTVTLRTSVPVLGDTYAEHRGTGAFLLIDPHSGITVGAGLIQPAEAVAG